ncbi:MAG: DUF349 domain-containing protein [Bacteroidia bacterium]|nr:DUF349 domain-containing protein [Bacteroidia bacterium]
MQEENLDNANPSPEGEKESVDQSVENPKPEAEKAATEKAETIEENPTEASEVQVEEQSIVEAATDDKEQKAEEDPFDSKPESIEEAPEGHHEEEHFEDEVELVEQIDVASMGKAELIIFVDGLIENPKLNIIKSHLNEAKDKFDAIVLEEKKAALAKWIEGGGVEDDFKPEKNPDNSKFFSGYKKVNKLRRDILHARSKEKDDNLKLKKDLLARMKDIIQNENDIPKAFNEFHNIQDKWREVGPVPGSEVKDLWMTYKLYVDKFYDLIKINRELQKLDQNKNLEIKANFCEQMEDLLAEKDFHRVMMRSRSLQNRWRSVGPVPRAKNDEIWTRFKTAIERLNERQEKHKEELKERYAKNLIKKTELCEKAEAYKSFESAKHSDWQSKIKEVVDLQNKWNKAGPVEKEHNEDIWKRFRSACSEFFKKKNEFYQSRKQDLKANIQLKTELCIQAEALQESDDWRETSTEFKKLQDKWKESGRIPDRQSKDLWARFKKAGDVFFTRKSEHYAGFEKEQEANLKLKNELIDKIDKFSPGDDAKENLNQLKQFQREWMDIGFIPIKAKNAVQKKFRTAIDKQFNALNIDEVQKEKIKFSQKVDSLKAGSDSSHKIKSEKFHISKKLKSLEGEVNQLENNIGFFSHSKNAQDMKKSFEEKIEKAKEEIDILKEKLKLLKQA